MSKQNSLHQIAIKLTNEGIMFSHDLQRNKIILDPINKPEKMTWPTWQFQLKLVSYFNQQACCICKKRLTNIRELHHAIISRNDVKGCKQEIKNLIHHSYNVLEICKNCHLSINRNNASNYLAELFGQENVIKWYNEFPLKTKVYRIESYFTEIQ